MKHRVKEFLNQLKNLQIHQEDAFYREGLFPSQRFHAYLPYLREDDNIYFSALIAFGLLRLDTFFDPEEKKIAHEIRRKTLANYAGYESVHKKNLYNFYRTNPPGHYPNGYFLSGFSRFQLPTDADDTVLIHLSAESPFMLAQQVKVHLEQHAGTEHRPARNTLKPYQKLRAYSTWFGSEKMPVEYDFCVLCNILYFVCQYKLPWAVQDEESLLYLASVIRQKEYLHFPFRVSYIYPRPAIMLYHLTRLMQSFELDVLNRLREEIQKDIAFLMLEPRLSKMEKVLLRISGLRLGMRLPAQHQHSLKFINNNFAFFHAPLPAGTSSGLLNRVASCELFHILYRCEALDIFLELEQEILEIFQ